MMFHSKQVYSVVFFSLFACGLNASDFPAPLETNDVVYLVNSTNKTLSFDLYYYSTTGELQRSQVTQVVEPGESSKWKLANSVAEPKENLYPIGFVGFDQLTGRRHIWGAVGGSGMKGIERLKALESDGAKKNIRMIGVKAQGNLN